MCRLTQTVCLLYLIVSGPIVVKCARLDLSKVSLEPAHAERAEHSETVGSGHPWCNFFSSQPLKWYHFDVIYGDNKCEEGACAAIELVRDHEKPVMNVHGSRQWLVQKEKDGSLNWDLYSPGPEDSGKTVAIDLLDVEVVRLFDGDAKKKLPDKLEITISTKNKTHGGSVSKREIFELEGGLYYDEYLLQQGFEKMNGEEFGQVVEKAQERTHAAAGRSKGKWVGGGLGALAVGGMYTAATVAGTAVQTQALIGAAVCGVIGGSIAGFVAGGILGLGVSVALVMTGYKQIKGYTITPASRKIFEKLRCLTEFKECSTPNILVPKDKECPRA